MNSIFGNNQTQQPNTGNGAPAFNPMAMIQQFHQFRNSFQGDPKQEVMRLLSTGQMSNAQFQQLSQMARQFGGLLK